jgi:hypothetical protein
MEDAPPPGAIAADGPEGNWYSLSIEKQIIATNDSGAYVRRSLDLKEEMRMNIPGFVAEAALYNSLLSYGSGLNPQIGMSLDIIPQLSQDWTTVRCRVNCFARFRARPDLLRACLDEC